MPYKTWTQFYYTDAATLSLIPGRDDWHFWLQWRLIESNKEGKFLKKLWCCIGGVSIKHLMTGPEGNSEFCFPRISMFPETKSRETLRFEGNKIHCSPRDQSLSDCYIAKQNSKAKFENRAEIPAITCNSSQQWTVDRVTVNCFPFDVIVFAMLPARGIWRETVSLLDVMWPWTSQWKDAL